MQVMIAACTSSYSTHFHPFVRKEVFTFTVSSRASNGSRIYALSSIRLRRNFHCYFSHCVVMTVSFAFLRLRNSHRHHHHCSPRLCRKICALLKPTMVVVWVACIVFRSAAFLVQHQAYSAPPRSRGGHHRRNSLSCQFRTIACAFLMPTMVAVLVAYTVPSAMAFFLIEFYAPLRSPRLCRTTCALLKLVEVVLVACIVVPSAAFLVQHQAYSAPPRSRGGHHRCNNSSCLFRMTACAFLKPTMVATEVAYATTCALLKPLVMVWVACIVFRSAAFLVQHQTYSAPPRSRGGHHHRNNSSCLFRMTTCAFLKPTMVAFAFSAPLRLWNSHRRHHHCSPRLCRTTCALLKPLVVVLGACIVFPSAAFLVQHRGHRGTVYAALKSVVGAMAMSATVFLPAAVLVWNHAPFAPPHSSHRAKSTLPP